MPERTSPPASRRSFIARLSVLAGAVGLPVSRLAAGEHVAEPALPQTKWDLGWLESLKGKHRQVFSLGELENGVGLIVVTNWLDAHQEVFGLTSPQVNAVVGIAGKSFAINAGDALWAKYELGKRYDVTDPDTNAPAVRNVFLHGRRGPLGKVFGVEPLQARGAIFWQCNNALTAVAGMLAKATNQPADAVKAELVAGLNPGVKLIPAHTMLLGLAQEHGCTYESIGG
jgi:hypothetical protein